MSAHLHISPLRHAGLLAVALLLSLTITVRAQTDTTVAKKAEDVRWSEDKLGQIEENLVRDLESSMVGVCIGGAQTAREMKKHAPNYDFSKIIIPLMRIVKDEDADRAARIVAALALHDLESERGDFAISREGEMAKDEIFKSFCASLARTRTPATKK